MYFRLTCKYTFTSHSIAYNPFCFQAVLAVYMKSQKTVRTSLIKYCLRCKEHKQHMQKKYSKIKSVSKISIMLDKVLDASEFWGA